MVEGGGVGVVGGGGGCWLSSFFDGNSLWKAELSESGKSGIRNEDGKKQGMTVSDIKGLFWSTDERLIMINAS